MSNCCGAMFKSTIYNYCKSEKNVQFIISIKGENMLVLLPQLESWGSQSSSEQSCDSVLLHSISVLRIWSTPNSKRSSLLGTGLNWTGDWTGNWTGLGTGLDWTGLDWTGLDSTRLDWTGLDH